MPRRSHLDLVRERFTRTAQPFARFALGWRSEEAERLAALALGDVPDAAESVGLDVACGPGTFTRAFAARMRFISAVDLTPAMLSEAVQAATRAKLANAAFACADAYSLPIAGSAVGLAACAYAFHHFTDPGLVVGELARVVRSRGRLALVDLIVPEGAQAELTNRIERARDPSHASTLTGAELKRLLEAGGFGVLAAETSERRREFNDWMLTVAAPPGSDVYNQTRRLMESTGEAGGFRPRPLAGGDLEWAQTSFFVVAEKR